MSFNFHVYKQDQQNHIQFKHKMKLFEKKTYPVSLLTISKLGSCSCQHTVCFKGYVKNRIHYEVMISRKLLIKFFSL